MEVLEPILNRVVLKQVETKTRGSFIMAPEGQKSANKATVLAVGPGMWDIHTAKYVPCTLKQGDTVLINPYLGTRANLEGQDVIIQKEEEILAKVQG
jgi:chaperonin GroES